MLINRNRTIPTGEPTQRESRRLFVPRAIIVVQSGRHSTSQTPAADATRLSKVILLGGQRWRGLSNVCLLHIYYLRGFTSDSNPAERSPSRGFAGKTFPGGELFFFFA